MRNLRLLLIPLLGCALLAGGQSFHAQGNVYSPDQINQMVAPIALYPDALMSQVLMASTYPNQVLETEQWIQANPGLSGARLDQALATATWDPSVISLSKFPTVLNRMAQNITWTTDLGNAFLNQRTDVMSAVQDLRSAAYENGTLRTTEQERVEVQGPDIVIQPASPQVIYVPTYQPSVVYGAYWNYPSYYYPGVWDPWPGYSFVNGFAWGLGYLFSNILFGGCDWGHHDVWMDYGAMNNCAIYNNASYNGGYGGGGYGGHQRWNHNTGVDYSNGGTGAPYGGRTNGRINGVTAGSAVRRTEPAAVQGTRGDTRQAQRGQTGDMTRGNIGQAQRGQTGDMTRGSIGQAQRGQSTDMTRGDNRQAQRGQATDMTRGNNRQVQRGQATDMTRGDNRQAQRGQTGDITRGANRQPVQPPTGYSRQGYNRSAQQGMTNYPARGDNRSTAHGPSGTWGQAPNRSAVNGSADYPVRGANRPTAHGPSGYMGQGSNRATAGPTTNYGRPAARPNTNSQQPNYGRSAARPQANYARPSYDRPAARPQANFARPSYDRPAARPQTNFARPGTGSSSSRPSMQSSGSHASNGHAGGSRQAPAAPRGGRQAHR